MKDDLQRRELLRADDEMEMKHEAERESKTRARKERFIQYIRIGVEAGGIVLPLVCYGVWLKRGFEFEKEGTVTSSFFKTMINPIKPTK